MRALNLIRVLVWAALAAVFQIHAAECPVRVGEYSGTVKAEWLTKTREMKLLEPFAFKGPDCKVWPVPKGAIIDGASIPQVFWSLIGGPFEGRYRDASVVHDYYCKIRTEPSAQVHEMFYYAMLANGVDSINAKTMYYAVHWFGPQWTLFRSIRRPASTSPPYGPAVVITADDLKPTRDLVGRLARTVGQPSPLEFESAATASFRDRTNRPYDPAGTYLVRDGAAFPERQTTIELTGFTRAPKPPFFEVAVGSADSEGVFRVLTTQSSASPTASQVTQLQRWIEAEGPALEALRSTSIDKLPR